MTQHPIQEDFHFQIKDFSQGSI